LSMAPLVRAMQPARVPPAPMSSPLLDILGFDAMHIDALLAHAGMAAAELSAQLLALELDGVIARLPGGMVQRVQSQP
jgi:DNA processing protein